MKHLFKRRVLVVESDTDPGDMGEPRVFWSDEDRATVLVVPSPRLWPKVDTLTSSERDETDSLTSTNGAEAGDYVEDDALAWVAWLDAVTRYAPLYYSLKKHLGSDLAAAEVTAGAMLSFLADRGLKLRRDDH